MTVRCKFRCVSEKKIQASKAYGQASEHAYEYEFDALYSDKEEDKKYFAATPWGSLKIATFKESLFNPGDQYYIDIEKAD